MGWLFKSKPEKEGENRIETDTCEKNQEPIEILNTILSMMKCESTVTQETDEMKNIVLNISTDDAGRMIGEKGEALYSLQYLVNKILYSKNTNNPKVIIDVDHYRSKRKEKLIEMAQKAAENTKASGKATSLPPLNSYERKIVHESLQEDEVNTKSEGEGYYKRIFISLKK